MRKRVRWLAFLPAMVLMYFIFGFSGEGGEESASLSLRVTTSIIENVDKLPMVELTDAQKINAIQGLHTPVRKIAHMSEYAVLAMLFAFALTINEVKGKRRDGFTIVICMIYAMTDELHQTFIAGREGRILDVCIDSIGVWMGCFVYGRSKIETKIVKIFRLHI